MKISQQAIDHPAVVSILLIALLLGSVVGVSSLRQQLFAEIELPQVVVLTTYPGASPEDVEREVTEPLEDQLKTLDGVTAIDSTSSQSSSFISVSFTLDSEISDHLMDIREQINQVQGELPDDITGPPMIIPFSTSALSAYSAVVESDMDRLELSALLEDELLPQLARISGVGQAQLSGGVESEVEVMIDPDGLNFRNLSVTELAQIVSASVSSLPAGEVESAGERLSIRSEGSLENLADLENLVLRVQGPSSLRLGDVSSSISMRESERDVIPVTNGEEAMIITVDLLMDADTPRALGQVKQQMRQFSRDQAGQINFSTVTDDSDLIRLSLTSVVNSALLGGLLAVITLFLFLHNIRSTVIIGLSIPLSLMIALMIMAFSGMTLNILTLTGLTIAIGMIVDASIVMLEHIFSFYKEGMSRHEAASRGAREMGGAILASTMTTLAVFLPMLFLQGIVGKILRDISLTLSVSLAGSLLVALTVVPYLAAHTLAPNSNRLTSGARLDKLFAFVERGLNWLTNRYKQLIQAALHNRVFVISTAVVLLVISFMLTRFLGFEFVPQTDMSEAIITIDFPAGYTMEKNVSKMEDIERETRRLVPEIESAVFYSGQSGLMHFGGSDPEAGFAVIRLVGSSQRDRGLLEIIDQLQIELPAIIPDVNITVSNGGLTKLVDASVGGAGFIIEVSGTSMDEVLTASDSISAIMEQDPNIIKVDSSVDSDSRSMIVDLDHTLMGNLGISAQEASYATRIFFNGSEVGQLTQDGEELPIYLDSPLRGEELASEQLSRLELRGASGQLVPMSAFSQLIIQRSVSSIQHSDGVITVTLQGQLSDTNIRETQSRVVAALDKANFPQGVDWSIGGSAEELASSMNSLFLVLGISVFLVYMVMVIQFERFIQPLIVMASVPFTLIGVVLSLLIFGSTLNVISLLGVIALAGIVVNNAIVLIDYTNLLRFQGDSLWDAVVKGASSRLKPILMTTLTTVLGILPIAFGAGEGGDLLKSLGQAIAGGLITSTLITMVLIPVIYYIVEKRLEQRRSARKEA